MLHSRFRRLSTTTAALASVTLLLSACASGSGSGSNGNTDGDVEGAAASDGSPEGGGDAGADHQPDPDGTIVYYQPVANDTLDPVSPVNDSSQAQTALMLIYDRLVHLDSDGLPVPGLATEWGFTDEESTEFQLTLREGVTFHDGEELDADAVVANLNRLQDVVGEAGSIVTGAAELIESVEATDSRTVTVQLNEPDGGFVYRMAAQPGMMISPASLDGSVGADLDPVGTGPYVVDSFTASEVTTLGRWEEYWDGVGDRPASFEVHSVAEAQTRLNALRSGQANIALLDPNQVSEVDRADLELKVNETLSTWTLAPNFDSPMSDLKLRQAMSMAIDREAIAEGLSFGTGEPTNQMFPTSSPVFIEEHADLYSYDPEGARELLEEAGYGDGVELEFVLLNVAEYMPVFEAIQQYWSEVGVSLDVQTIDVSQNTLFVDGELGDLIMIRNGGEADPLVSLQKISGPGGTWTPGGTVSEEYNELLDEAAAVEAGTDERLEALREANRLGVEQQATINIMDRANIYGYEPGCFDGPGKYIGQGADDWSDVTIGVGCS